mmetsp:Transcript_12083/g.25949  ORF Transcript_12083/g.25949 Transcript_12083/m.25949 type:complete len:410 (+) Transcript_12083:145-1374(+)|eukprot:CAMPEP_0202891700 /NCGR_PEP_ID=MMETSP1392-20130828/1689_1 /ASSEMBLY_ACC=CAM_ASM_000868 /TAXON_ID=225041 /ORGANISM="Chlamydomonas chlamydogama, Strain SAG 11-48b" /LENGTH=409 /DNA_ID=CAMNT_0049575527 /DNA_START=133 /DNA_END=1362 /DNA_ORIENTATION=+
MSDSSSAKADVKEAVENVVSQASSAASSATKVASQAVDDVKKSASEKVDDAKKAASSAADEVTSALKATTGTLQGFGSPAATSSPAAAPLSKIPTPAAAPVVPPSSPPAVTPTKTLDFGTQKEQSSPITPSTPFVAPKGSSDVDLDYNQFITDTCMWTNTVRSAVYLVGGILTILFIRWMLNCSTPAITVLCHLALLQMMGNFFKAIVSARLQEKGTYLDSAWTHSLIGAVGSAIKTVAAVHDKHLLGTDSLKHLQIAVFFWLLSIIARYVSATALVLVVYIGAFTIPKAYTVNKSKIDPVVKDVYTKAQTQLDRTPRLYKAAALAVVIMLFGYLMSRIDIFIALFVVAIYGYSMLRPTEVEAIGKRITSIATPLTATAKKATGQIGKLMGDTINKYELTPTPMKKKNQ